MSAPTFAIAIPCSGRYVPPEWAIALANLQFPTNTGFCHLMLKRMQRDKARSELVRQAILRGCRYIWFLDDDTMPPPDAVRKLYTALENADDDVVACGGIYSSKGSIPSEPLVYIEENGGPFWKWKAGQVFQCHSIGTGCLMIKTEVFKHLPEPWFRDINCVEEVGDDPSITLVDGTCGFCMTDDVYWCQKVHQAGFKILAHGGVLPVHWDQQGNPYTLPRDSYPMKDAGEPWYSAFGIVKENLVNPEQASPPPSSPRGQQ